ncbi:MAG: hypothetical protein WA609_14540 [Terriglobales bacterium]
MSQRDEKEESGEARPLPTGFCIVGWLAFVPAFALALRLVYEQTVMTWNDGPQALGFALWHVYVQWVLIGLLGALFVHLWLVSFTVLSILRRVTQRGHVSITGWMQFAILAATAGLFYIPYGPWQLISLEVAGPGPRAVDQLGFAVVQKQPYLVKALLSKGVSIDATGYLEKTALENACNADELDMSRYFVSKGASLEKAPGCRKFPEFAVLMKPIMPPVKPQTGRLQVPGTTIEVTAPEPAGAFPMQTGKH